METSHRALFPRDGEVRSRAALEKAISSLMREFDAELNHLTNLAFDLDDVFHTLQHLGKETTFTL